MEGCRVVVFPSRIEDDGADVTVSIADPAAWLDEFQAHPRRVADVLALVVSQKLHAFQIATRTRRRRPCPPG